MNGLHCILAISLITGTFGCKTRSKSPPNSSIAKSSSEDYLPIEQIEKDFIEMGVVVERKQEHTTEDGVHAFVDAISPQYGAIKTLAEQAAASCSRNHRTLGLLILNRSSVESTVLHQVNRVNIWIDAKSENAVRQPETRSSLHRKFLLADALCKTQNFSNKFVAQSAVFQADIPFSKLADVNLLDRLLQKALKLDERFVVLSGEPRKSNSSSIFINVSNVTETNLGDIQNFIGPQ